VGQDVHCLHCDQAFKAEAVGEDTDGLPECPRCGATPLDFHPTPWWRD
jgi:NAD-dependent SIR2 family protein deacetylase